MISTTVKDTNAISAQFLVEEDNIPLPGVLVGCSFFMAVSAWMEIIPLIIGDKPDSFWWQIQTPEMFN